MEPNDSRLSSYYHHHHHQQQQQPQQQQQQQPPPPTPQQQQQPPPQQQQSPTVPTSQTNGLLSNTHTTTEGPPLVYPHSAPSAVSSPLENVKRKRGRPRKYGTPEQALAAKRTASSSPSSSVHVSSKKKDPSLGGSVSGGSSKKSQLVALGNAGQGFTPHIISVAAGEDVAQKIMVFMQQSKREICILSASGSISNASLRQPATSGGNITYEGRFEIVSLSGSYVRTELGGRTGGLSVCLSNTDGQIVGGGVGGPLKAAGPVQVIVGTFVIDTKKDVVAGVKADVSASQMSSPVGGTSASSAGFRSALGGQDDHQSPFMIQPRQMQMTSPRPTDWRGAPDSRSSGSYELTGRAGHGAHQSPENGEYDNIPD